MRNRASIYMSVTQWALSILFALIVLWQIVIDNATGFVLFAIACGLVLPVLDSVIEKNIPFLKMVVLRIFIAVVIAIAALGMAGGKAVPMADISDVQFCVKAESGRCSADRPFFLEGENAIKMTAVTQEGSARSIRQVAVEVSYIAYPGSEPEVVLSEVVYPAFAKSSLTVTIPKRTFAVGSYDVKMVFTGKTGTVIERAAAFTVWSSLEAVEERFDLGTTSTEFKDILAANYVCPYLKDVSQVSEDGSTYREEFGFCDAIEDIPVDQAAYVIDYRFSEPTTADTRIRYSVRYLPPAEKGDEPVLIFSEVANIEKDIRSFGSVVTMGEGVTPGNYEILSDINDPAAKPSRIEFSIVE